MCVSPHLSGEELMHVPVFPKEKRGVHDKFLWSDGIRNTLVDPTFSDISKLCLRSLPNYYRVRYQGPSVRFRDEFAATGQTFIY